MHLSLIAPSFRISDQDLAKTLKFLKNLPWEFDLKSPLFESGHLCAASVEKRWTDLRWALTQSEADVIWCLRGGYGALHLLPQLQKLKMANAKKLLVGFSDITILHYFLNQVWNWPSLHFRHINSFVKDQSVAEGLKEFHKDYKFISSQEFLQFKGLKALNLLAKDKVKNSKKIQGKIVGGNLITLQSMVGLHVPTPQGKILFLEEIDEPIYKIDRALTQLLQAGWLKGVKAILLGSFTHSQPETQKQTLKYLKTQLDVLPVPVFGFLPCGHRPKQKPLFFNTPSEIFWDTSGSIVLKNQTVKF